MKYILLSFLLETLIKLPRLICVEYNGIYVK